MVGRADPGEEPLSLRGRLVGRRRALAGWPEGRKCSGALKARAWSSTIHRAGRRGRGKDAGESEEGLQVPGPPPIAV